MKKLNRVNKMGVQYYITELPDGKTEIRTGEKKIVVNCHIEQINQGWFYWMNGRHVQEAFNFMTPPEREFLMTGITETEWNEIFKEEEDNGN